MNVKVVQRPLFSPWMDTNTIGRTQHRSLQLPWKARDLERPEVLVSVHSNPRTSGYQTDSYGASVAHSRSLRAPASLDGSSVLKGKSQEIEPYLSHCCIYLVGMIGSGKTTVGKILSQVLGYSFVDCDSLVEQDVGGTSVADILSFMETVSSEKRRRYMHKGISVWLDVPLDALAKRIAAVGTHSCPLLHGESGDVYNNKSPPTMVTETCPSLHPQQLPSRHLEQMECYLKDVEEMPVGTL